MILIYWADIRQLIMIIIRDRALDLAERMGERRAKILEPITDNRSQQLKVLHKDDNHSHPASKDLPTTNQGKSTINFSNQDWPVDKNLFVYISNIHAIIYPWLSKK